MRRVKDPSNIAGFFAGNNPDKVDRILIFITKITFRAWLLAVFLLVFFPNNAANESLPSKAILVFGGIAFFLAFFGFIAEGIYWRHKTKRRTLKK